MGETCKLIDFCSNKFNSKNGKQFKILKDYEMISPYYWTKMIKFECVTVDERSLRYLLLLLLCMVDWRLVFFFFLLINVLKKEGGFKKGNND